MKKLILITLTIAAIAAAQPAEARKACDELKQEIAAKIDANGVKTYTLEIVAADAVGDAKVVGSCDGGAQKITYRREPVAAPVATAQPAQGQPQG